ncbi:MAG: DUF58 domain-containing protein [Halobacteriales archaeon]
MRPRSLLIAAGLVAAAVGIAGVVAPGLVGLSIGDTAVTVLGALMLLRAATTVIEADTTIDQAETGDPERCRPMPRPGDETDMRLSNLNGIRNARRGRRKAIRDRVTRAAIDALVRTEGITESEARERIESEMDTTRREYEVIAGLDGAGADAAADGRGERIGRLVRQWRAGERGLQRRIRRAVDAVGSRLDLPSPEDGSGFPERLDAIADRLDRPTRDRPTGDGAPREAWTRIDEDTYRRERRETGHWVGMVALALAFGGAGVIVGRPPLLLAAAVGVGFAAHRGRAESADATVAIDRSIEPGDPEPGDPTTVTLTVRNDGDRRLPDLRIVDGVPERLEVITGAPRVGTALAPGEETTLQYEVLARRGTHEFGGVTVLSRDASGAIEDELVVQVETTLTGVPSFAANESPAPLRELAVGYVGRAATERGSGIEFDSVREYRPGDPLNRIDWGRYARNGDLATLRFREGRSTTVYVIVDARAEAYLAPDDGAHAVERGVDAAGRLFATLNATSTPVGIGALGPGMAWLEAGVGEHHRHRAEQLLGRDPAFHPLPPADQIQLFERLREIRGRLPGDAQIVFVTPLCDGVAPFVARRLDDYGHPVTVLSPDPTSGETTGGTLVRIERRLWSLELTGAGIRVIDWEWEQPLEVALRRAATGEST